ncbi:MAG TPA: helix-turn-helix domain-containing protein [Micromonosporaceae bacterium]|nr:helix-turn-helix domain-containing protein [Micromonosporaceae bacterium]
MPGRPSLSLRERKRLATWTALHEAALSMALGRDDLNQVTVEAIAEAANVSPRTFFNYFNSKEDAVLGLHEPMLSEAETTRFAEAGEDVLVEAVVRLLYEVSYCGALGAGEARQRRRAVLHRYPELVQRLFAHFLKVEQMVTRVVAERLRTSPRWRADPGQDVDQAAQMIVMTAGAALRMAARQTAATGSAADEEAALDHGISLLRDIARKIS